jgi:hypothetical protein
MHSSGDRIIGGEGVACVSEFTRVPNLPHMGQRIIEWSDNYLKKLVRVKGIEPSS